VSDTSAPPATRIEPPITEEAEGFWDATRRRELVLPWCGHCQRAFWYPRPVCPSCLSPDVGWKPASGRGQVHAVSVMYRPANPTMAGRVPYAVALVDLDEGVRVMSNVVGVEASEVKVGMDVAVTWEPMSDGRNLPLFAPDARTP
jgi:uncharacterized OB-fold protein